MPTCPLCHAQKSAVFMKKDGYTLYRCGQCGFTFVHPIPNSAEVYSQDYFAGAVHGFGYVDYDTDKAPMVHTFEKYMRHIRALVPTGGRLLDVGAATGFFLDIAKRFGFEVHGVEISAFAAAQAREKGLDVLTGTLADTPKDLLFDVITMLDVIEHVSDPREEILRVKEIMRPGGVLVINTPDAGSLYARMMGKRWHLIVPPEHLYYFTRKNIRMLLEEEGFEVLSITTIGKQFTLPYIFKMLYAWQKLSVWKWLSTIFAHGWLSRIGIPINLRDNMFVLAKKK
jgi:2-polyprenyl-3-methyl-5-hydroxy-6-metoxy-1,4-benzoquinol methylase